MLRQRLTALVAVQRPSVWCIAATPVCVVQQRTLRTVANPILCKAPVKNRFRSRRAEAVGPGQGRSAAESSPTPPLSSTDAQGTTLSTAGGDTSVGRATPSAEGATGPAAAAVPEEAHASPSPSPSPSTPESSAAPSPAQPAGGGGGIERLFASWQQGVVASIGAVMGIGFLMYLLYTPVKEDTVHHTAVVASEALGDLRLRAKAVQLSKGIVGDVLRDDKSLELVVELVRKLLAQEDTKVAISSLLQSLFEDHYTQEVTKKFVLMIVRDPWIMDQLQVIVKEQIMRLFADKEVKAALSNFLSSSAMKSLREPELQYATARAVRSSVARAVNPWSA